jgi:hypothetical protein
MQVVFQWGANWPTGVVVQVDFAVAHAIVSGRFTEEPGLGRGGARGQGMLPLKSVKPYHIIFREFIDICFEGYCGR